MSFKNRESAAQLLAEALHAYQGKNPLILAIPRGAVPMGKIIAERLGGDLDVVLVHKISAPMQEEFAIGAIDENGTVYLSEDAAQISTEYIEQAAQQQLALIKQRRVRYTQGHITPIKDRVVIVVDDGIATGATMLAALQSLRAQHPARLIAATAVAPPETLAQLKSLADEIICLETPSSFSAVGQFFTEFLQVSDDEVVAILSEKPSLKC